MAIVIDPGAAPVAPLVGSLQPMATVDALTAYMGTLVPGAVQLLRDATDDLTSRITAPYTVNADGLSITPWIAQALSDACVRQVAYMLEVGTEVGVVGAPRQGRVTIGSLQQSWQPGRVGPRALDILARHGFLVVR